MVNKAVTKDMPLTISGLSSLSNAVSHSLCSKSNSRKEHNCFHDLYCQTPNMFKMKLFPRRFLLVDPVCKTDSVMECIYKYYSRGDNSDCMVWGAHWPWSLEVSLSLFIKNSNLVHTNKPFVSNLISYCEFTKYLFYNNHFGSDNISALSYCELNTYTTLIRTVLFVLIF
jgi:hypothetical protein